MKRLLHTIRARIHARIEELCFQGSIRAIKETRWMADETARASALMGHERTADAIRHAFATYTPPTPWADAWVDEVTQVLDSVIAEQFRLQSQIDDLQHLLRDALAARVPANDDPWLLRDNR